MSRWADQIESGMGGKGAARRLRTLKRREAEHRSDATPYARTRAYMRSLDVQERNAYIVAQHVERVKCSASECWYVH